MVSSLYYDVWWLAASVWIHTICLFIKPKIPHKLSISFILLYKALSRLQLWWIHSQCWEYWTWGRNMSLEGISGTMEIGEELRGNPLRFVKNMQHLLQTATWAWWARSNTVIMLLTNLLKGDYFVWFNNWDHIPDIQGEHLQYIRPTQSQVYMVYVYVLAVL